MKYQKSMNSKIRRITNFVKYEIRSGQCSQDDIDHILNHLRYTIHPWTPEDEKYEVDQEREIDLNRSSN